MVNVKVRGACTIDGCERPHRAHGFCATHLSRVNRTGNAGDAGLINISPTANLAERLEHTGWDEVVRVPALGPCHEWRGALANGYGVVARGDGTHVGTHRAAYEAHVGPIPAGMLACHRCDNPPCMNADHIFIGSHQNNSQDMVAKGRHGRNSAKLTDDQAFEIRTRYSYGDITQRQLGEMFGISRSKISNVVNRKTYRHIE